MARRLWRRYPAARLLISAYSFLGSSAALSGHAGVVVENLGRELRPEQVALRPGDVVTGWTRANARGSIRSPFDLWPVSVEQLPRGPVVLEVLRDGRPVTVTIPPSAWPFEIETRPELAPDVLAAYEHGRGLVQEKTIEDGVGAWRAVLDRARSTDAAAACWLLARMGRAWGEADRRPEFEQAHAEALDCVRNLEPAAAAAVRAQQAWQALEKNWLDVADRAFRARLEPAAAPDGPLSQADVAVGLSRVRYLEGRTAESIDLLRQALTVQEAETAESLVVVRSLSWLGLSLVVVNDIEAAERELVRAEALAARIGPGSPMHVLAIRMWAGAAAGGGDLITAQRLSERALELAPPDSDSRTAIYLMLGAVAAVRGDIDTAESWTQRGLVLAQKNGHRLRYRVLLANLGCMAVSRGELEEGERLMRRALSEAGTAEPHQMVTWLIDLAPVRLERSDPVEAKALFEQALAIAEKASVGGVRLATALLGLADLARMERDWNKAQTLYGRALSALAGAEPTGYLAARGLHGLGAIQRAHGRDEEAAALLARAVDALEAVRGQMGSSDEARSLVNSQHHGIYHDHAELLVKMARVEEAFGVLELSRARALLALLAERDLILNDEIPRELEQQRRRVDAEYQRTHNRWLQSAEAGNAAKKESLSARLTDLRRQQIEIADKVRAASPRLAELRYPEPMPTAEIQASLEPGTVLIAYSTGAEGGLLFAVTRETLEVVAIPIADAELRRRVARWRGWAEQSVPRPEFHAEARALYDLLLRPVERRLVEARRILIGPSGPLHALPFAALRRGKGYLADWKPLTIVPSGTMHAQWSKGRREAWPRRSFVGFADPLRPAAGFDTLPSSREEVTALARLYGKETRIHVGDAATEDQAKRLGKGARYIHFACHGLVNEHRPLDSGLVLHAPRKAMGDDGLLQAWEIYERVRIDADLVTLSACDSGTGLIRAGEGLLGLTRAFHYAGARSVLASLWSVGDKSSLWLMERFHSDLARGFAKDEALKRTQQAAVRAGRRPAAWAAYQLYGDWR